MSKKLNFIVLSHWDFVIISPFFLKFILFFIMSC